MTAPQQKTSRITETDRKAVPGPTVARAWMREVVVRVGLGPGQGLARTRPGSGQGQGQGQGSTRTRPRCGRLRAVVRARAVAPHCQCCVNLTKIGPRLAGRSASPCLPSDRQQAGQPSSDTQTVNTNNFISQLYNNNLLIF